MTEPLVYTPSMETQEPDEAATIEEMVSTLLRISETTYRDGHHALRSVHAKSHAILKGKLTVLPQLTPELAQGMFAHAATYPAILRFSSTPGDMLNDSVSTPRGLAMKLLGVPGARLPESELATTQDFIFVNGPAFAASNAKSFLKNLKLLASTTDKVPALKAVLATALRGAETLVEAVGAESGTLKSLGGHPATHPLGETFYTQVPVLYGKYMAKLSVAPLSAELAALKGVHVNITHSPNALRELLVDYFQAHTARWEVRVQLCRNIQDMPIEDSSAVWSEEISPFAAVAHLDVPRQCAWSEERSVAVDDHSAFSPWHGIAAHRPLGSIMRVRKAAYEASAQFRSNHNKHPLVEPLNSDSVV